MAEAKSEVFLREVAVVINRLSLEGGSNTPDYILAAYLWDCLTAFNEGVYQRSKWYGRQDIPGAGIQPVETAAAPADTSPLAGCGNWKPKHGTGPYCGNCGFHESEHRDTHPYTRTVRARGT